MRVLQMPTSQYLPYQCQKITNEMQPLRRRDAWKQGLRDPEWGGTEQGQACSQLGVMASRGRDRKRWMKASKASTLTQEEINAGEASGLSSLRTCKQNSGYYQS